ncbi:MAG: ATP-binding cassette domain-containing protein [Polyangiaceae bacterium]|nr:ATP-binding cassette domain-containing protein [Polyangiaceae bacterium]
MTLLSVRGVSLSVPGRRLLRDLELNVPHAGWVGVAGPSGSGKTRLLRAIAGLCDADAGEFRLRGTDRQEMAYPEWRRRVSYVGQRAVFLKGTVRFNLERPFSYASVGARFDVAAAARELEQLRLPRTVLEQDARSLSVGEQQRVALLRTVSIAPDVVLLDEPTSALDEESVSAVETWLRARAEAGLSGVIVSHDATQLTRLTTTQLNLTDFSPGVLGA